MIQYRNISWLEIFVNIICASFAASRKENHKAPEPKLITFLGRQLQFQERECPVVTLTFLLILGKVETEIAISSSFKTLNPM